MTAGPDGVRDPVPNSPAASKAETLNGFSRSSVRPIVISFSSFLPAPTHVRAVHRPTPARTATRVIVAHAVWAFSLLNHGRSPVAVRPPGVRRDRVLQSRATRRRVYCPV